MNRGVLVEARVFGAELMFRPCCWDWVAIGVPHVQPIHLVVVRERARLEVAVHAVRDRVGMVRNIWESRHENSEPE